MGTVLSNAFEFAKLLVPDREQLVQWGLLGPEDPNNDANMKKMKDNHARAQRRLMKDLKPIFKSLNLRERDITTYMDAYVDVDIDGTQSISYMNFCEFFHLIPSPFLEAMFYDFQPEKNMTFQHFVVITYFYCIAHPKDISAMIFSVYDRSNMGKIYPMQVTQLIREMYGKSFRMEPNATMAVVKLINIPNKQFGVDEAQFVEMLYRHQQPALSIQRDMIKGLMTPVFWKRAKKHPPLVNFREAWKMQTAYTEKCAEDAKKASEIAAYRSRGGEWKEGAPVPSQVAKKLEADKEHEIQAATGTTKKSLDKTLARTLGRQRTIPKGITPLLKKKKRVTHQFIPSKSGVGGVLMIIDEDGNQQKSKWDDVVVPEIVRPKTLRIRKQRIPDAIGGDEFASAKTVIKNFESLTSGRDVGKLKSVLKG